MAHAILTQLRIITPRIQWWISHRIKPKITPVNHLAGLLPTVCRIAGKYIASPAIYRHHPARASLANNFCLGVYPQPSRRHALLRGVNPIAIAASTFRTANLIAARCFRGTIRGNNATLPWSRINPVPTPPHTIFTRPTSQTYARINSGRIQITSPSSLIHNPFITGLLAT